MPDEERAFPRIPAKQWHAVRAKVTKSPSTPLTPTTVSVVCGLKDEASARVNVIVPLRTLGIIDDEGNLTDLGHLWRVDATYAEACAQIVANVYPGELGLLVGDDGNADLGQLRTWFMKHERVGESAARACAVVYHLVAEPNFDVSRSTTPRTTTRRASAGKTPVSSTTGSQEASKRAATTPLTPVQASAPPALPVSPVSRVSPVAAGPASVAVNIDIRLPEGADSAYIDRVFASIRRNLIAPPAEDVPTNAAAA